jgi:hypothetical protein
MLVQIRSNNANLFAWSLILCCFNLISCSKLADQECHYIPNGFRGRIYIFYDVPKGSDLRLNKKRIYNISTDGYLLSSLQPNDGFIKDSDRSFYYVDGNVKRKLLFVTEINAINSKKDEREICAFNLIVGQTRGISYLSYCIDTLKNAAKYYEPNLHIQDKIIDSILKYK